MNPMSSSNPTFVPVTAADRQTLTLATLREVILGLIAAREQLGFELAHAEGLMSDETLDDVLKGYLALVPVNLVDLVEKARILHWIVPEKFDSELVQVVFKCSPELAARAVADVFSDVG